MWIEVFGLRVKELDSSGRVAYHRRHRNKPVQEIITVLKGSFRFDRRTPWNRIGEALSHFPAPICPVERYGLADVFEKVGLYEGDLLNRDLLFWSIRDKADQSESGLTLDGLENFRQRRPVELSLSRSVLANLGRSEAPK